uniref:Uncharacterized protein n=1 Tax=Rhizophora mucronata TaxID=61149 RepID=A0A2P2PEU6_RHIMU
MIRGTMETGKSIKYPVKVRIKEEKKAHK